ncbi:DnaJ family domain-containing protein [Agrococcus carbonis]|uniref:DnaJ homologue subfamily C member 28 conserved domain-containing protein n=1 Tax=Agrococcus carbonis TaxID=684552 RepID=A0A1H1KTA5_9MICO|nr:DUF1992 domain-containing protein [Agrococcus carbonis]SDR65250.1 protein of unknown function [Agrococcus carbonis]
MAGGEPSEHDRIADAVRRLERAEEAERDADDRARLRREAAAARRSELERAAIVDTAIQQAIRRGEFDDLPGTGKPIPGLDRPYDPDWWIKRKIEREQLQGLGPAALTLRVEDAELEQRLDALGSEADARELLEDFNARVVEARRQLLGGPPVITATRDVEAELSAWRERRAARLAEQRERDAAERDAARPRRRWWRRR